MPAWSISLPTVDAVPPSEAAALSERGRVPFLGRRQRWLRALLLFFLLTRAASDVAFDAVRIATITPGLIENAVVVIAALVAWPDIPRPWQRFCATAFAPLALWQLVATFYGPAPAEAARGWFAQLTYPAMFMLAVAAVASGVRLRTLTLAMLASLSLPLLTAFLQVARDPGTRPPGTFAHENILALYIAFLLPAMIWEGTRAVRSGNGRVALMWAIASLAAMVVELLTQTRGAWAAVALSLVLWTLMVERRALPLVLVSLVLAFASPFVRDRLSQQRDFSGVTVAQVRRGEVILDSFSWRKLLWSAALADSADSRLLGKGVLSFRTNVPGFFAANGATDPHNVYIQLLYEQGVVGLALYLWQWAVLGAASIRALSRSRMAGFICCSTTAATLLFGYSDNIYFYLSANWYAFAILGAVLAAVLGPPRRAARPSVAALR